MRCVVVGGGIAGVCCAEELCRLRPEFDVSLVSEDRTLKVHTLHSVRSAQSSEATHADGHLLCILHPIFSWWVHLLLGMQCRNFTAVRCSVSAQGVTNVVQLSRNVEEFAGVHGVSSILFTKRACLGTSLHVKEKLSTCALMHTL